GRQRKILLPGHFRSGAGTRLGVASRRFSKEFSVVFRFATGIKGMIDRSTVRRQVVEEFLGDVAPLAAQIGSAEGLLALSSGASPLARPATGSAVPARRSVGRGPRLAHAGLRIDSLALLAAAATGPVELRPADHARARPVRSRSTGSVRD